MESTVVLNFLAIEYKLSPLLTIYDDVLSVIGILNICPILKRLLVSPLYFIISSWLIPYCLPIE